MKATILVVIAALLTLGCLGSEIEMSGPAPWVLIAESHEDDVVIADAGGTYHVIESNSAFARSIARTYEPGDTIGVFHDEEPAFEVVECSGCHEEREASYLVIDPTCDTIYFEPTEPVGDTDL